jgi:hypothetical protein
MDNKDERRLNLFSGEGTEKMQIEIKPKGKVEYRGESRNGRILTIERQGKGYMVRAYQIKCDDLLREPLDWEGAFKVFQTISKKKARLNGTDEGKIKKVVGRVV